MTNSNRVMEIISGDKKRKISPLDKNTYLISGESRFLKWSLNEPPERVEFERGPRLCLGKDFYGKGIVTALAPADAEKSHKAVKVTVSVATS